MIYQNVKCEGMIRVVKLVLFKSRFCLDIPLPPLTHSSPPKDINKQQPQRFQTAFLPSICNPNKSVNSYPHLGQRPIASFTINGSIQSEPESESGFQNANNPVSRLFPPGKWQILSDPAWSIAITNSNPFPVHIRTQQSKPQSCHSQTQIHRTLRLNLSSLIIQFPSSLPRCRLERIHQFYNQQWLILRLLPLEPQH